MKVGLSDDDVEKKWTLTLKSMTAAPRLSGGKNWWEKTERDLVHTDCACSKFPQIYGKLLYFCLFFCCFMKHQNDVTVIYQLVSHGNCYIFLYDVVQYAQLRLGLEGFCLKKKQFLSIKSLCLYEYNKASMKGRINLFGYQQAREEPLYQALPFSMEHK